MIAIMLAAAFTLLQGLCKNLFLGEYVSASAPTDFGIMAIATSVETIVLLGIAILCFRAGWWDHEPILNSALHRHAAVSSVQVAQNWSTWNNPSRIRALLWQSLRAFFWPLLILAILSICFLNATGFRDNEHFIPLAFLSFILGFFTLSGEQNRQQYRVIADRGIHPIKYLLIRVSLPLALILLANTLAVSSIREDFYRGNQILLVFMINMAIYLSLVLATITIANPILSISLGLAMSVAFCFAGFSLVQAGGIVGLPILVALALIALALPCLLVRRWMQLENASLPLITSGSIIAICSTVFFVYAPLRAYSVPKVPLPAKSASTSRALSPFARFLTESQSNLADDELKAAIELLRSKQKETNLLPKIINQADFYVSNLQSNLSTDPAGNLDQSPKAIEGDSELAESNVITPPSQLKSLDQYRDILKKRLAQDLNASEDLKAEDTNDVTNVDLWKFQINRTRYTEWLIAILYVGMLDDDAELVTGAIKLYSQTKDPRYPWEFNLPNNDTLSSINTLLVELNGTASPKMYAIIFDQLTSNVPNANSWKDYCIEFASLSGSSHSNDSLARLAQQTYGFSSDLPAYEKERMHRIQAIEAMYTIEQTTQLIGELTSIHLSQANRSKEEEKTDWRVTRNSQYNPDEYFYYSSPSSDLRTRLRSEVYGFHIHYYFGDAADQLRQYLRLINFAANGTTATKTAEAQP
jgi:hypothetical protein